MPEGKATIQLIPRRGLSIISDIDDTVKVCILISKGSWLLIFGLTKLFFPRRNLQLTGVTIGKRTVLINVFLRESAAVPGMPECYQAWRDRGAPIHYVSNSPWQLVPTLSEFFQKTGLPMGSMHLKTFQMRPDNFSQTLLAPADASKRGHVEEIFRVSLYAYTLATLCI
jgi:phosphatidate phosphatase APP1